MRSSDRLSLLLGPGLLSLAAALALGSARHARTIPIHLDPDLTAHTLLRPPAPFVPEMHSALADAEVPYRAFVRLPAIRLLNLNTGEQVRIRLYDPRGELRDEALEVLDRVLCDGSEREEQVGCEPVDRRAIQLVFKAALHFPRNDIVLISGFRDPAKHGDSPHGQGKAIDFRLSDAKLSDLAAYVRGFGHAGVGVYTHPQTQYVHLDMRERSYHWVDASPPGAHGGERPLGDQEQLAAQDLRYQPSTDWPEGTLAPRRVREPAPPEDPFQPASLPAAEPQSQSPSL